MFGWRTQNHLHSILCKLLETKSVNNGTGLGYKGAYILMNFKQATKSKESPKQLKKSIYTSYIFIKILWSDIGSLV